RPVVGDGQGVLGRGYATAVTARLGLLIRHALSSLRFYPDCDEPERQAVRLGLRVCGGPGLARLVMLELGVDHRREDDREHQAEGDPDNDSLGSDPAWKLRPREPDPGEDDRPDGQRGPDHEEEPEGEDHGAGNATGAAAAG